MKVANHPSELWACFIKKTRQFFDSQKFLEVFTPSLVTAGAFENALDPLKVPLGTRTYQLHTSPEIEMKVLLAQEKRAIYQICKCYRDDPDTSIHFKEFSMLEFYRPFVDYSATQTDMIRLFSYLSGQELAFQKYSISELFKNRLNLDLEHLTDTPLFLKKSQEVGLSSLTEQDSWEDIFFRLMIEKIEPSLSVTEPTLVFDYPASVSTLSKPKNGFWGERFEIFWRGMEICNGATELLSLELLKTRYQFESNERAKTGKTPHPFPQRLADVIEQLPPCSGVAVGLDRLFWALTQNQTFDFIT
jgi:lysyl-tRNA synthetase class 2